MDSFRLLVIYRTHAGENRKGRPAFYDKALVARSLARAVTHLREQGGTVDLVVLNDGERPSPAVEPLAAVGGAVMPVPGGPGLRASLQTAVDLAVARADEVDCVYFAEDDYLYVPEAFAVLADVITHRPEIDFVSLYDHPDEYGGDGRMPAQVIVTPRAAFRGSISTCHTFAVRADVLHRRREVWMLRECVRADGAFDHWMWLGLLGGPLSKLFFRVALTGLKRRKLKILVRGPRLETRLLRRLRGPRLVMPLPGAATHVEEGVMGAGRDWAALARDLADEREVTGDVRKDSQAPVDLDAPVSGAEVGRGR